ncbi:hypothetical protein GC163_04315 [bacterium]|nr:hypothetical protein [bacterium]
MNFVTSLYLGMSLIMALSWENAVGAGELQEREAARNQVIGCCHRLASYWDSVGGSRHHILQIHRLADPLQGGTRSDLYAEWALSQALRQSSEHAARTLVELRVATHSPVWDIRISRGFLSETVPVPTGLAKSTGARLLQDLDHALAAWEEALIAALADELCHPHELAPPSIEPFSRI